MADLEIPKVINALIGGAKLKIQTKDYIEKVERAYNSNGKELNKADIKRSIWMVLNGMELDEVGKFIKEHIWIEE